MWKKLLIIFFLFYLFALLQTSFFTRINFLGTALNLVFIFFFLLVFFTDKDVMPQVVFFSAIGGIFLDIFSNRYLGVSILMMLIIGLVVKRAQALLKRRQDKSPFVYFLPLFIISLFAYSLAMKLAVNTSLVIYLAYNAVVASVLFYIYKRIPELPDNRQISLFKK